MNMRKVDHVEISSEGREGLRERPVFVVLTFGLVIIIGLFAIIYSGFFAH